MDEARTSANNFYFQFRVRRGTGIETSRNDELLRLTDSAKIVFRVVSLCLLEKLSEPNFLVFLTIVPTGKHEAIMNSAT